MVETAISLPEGIRKGAAEVAFWEIRGKAIQTYANLEQGMCRVFAHLSSSPDEVAGIVFFKITSTQARNSILDKLQRKKYLGKYNLFWNSFLDRLRPIDIKRNEIVHWNTINNIVANEKGETIAQLLLKPPTYWFGFDHEAPSITKEDMIAFANECQFYATHCNVFAAITSGSWIGPENEKNAWHDRFFQPIIYPPPEGHQLFRKQAIPDSPPRSSQA